MFGHQERRDQPVSTPLISQVTDGGDWEGGAEMTAHHRGCLGIKNIDYPQSSPPLLQYGWMRQEQEGGALWCWWQRAAASRNGRLNDLKASVFALTPYLQISSLGTVADKQTQLLTWCDLKSARTREKAQRVVVPFLNTSEINFTALVQLPTLVEQITSQELCFCYLIKGYLCRFMKLTL